jgi:hypothetical protein
MMKVGNYVFTHINRLGDFLENRDTVCSFKLCWVVNHIFSYFSFMISTLLYYKCLTC